MTKKDFLPTPWLIVTSLIIGLAFGLLGILWGILAALLVIVVGWTWDYYRHGPDG